MIQTHILRLRPGEKLKESIQQYVNAHHIKAGWITTCVGSLTKFNIRFANQQEASSATGHFEIVSLSGTVSENGSHIHISISDKNGKLIGGHLLDENIIFTTAEIVLSEDQSYEFTREMDRSTGYQELKVSKL